MRITPPKKKVETVRAERYDLSPIVSAPECIYRRATSARPAQSLSPPLT